MSSHVFRNLEHQPLQIRSLLPSFRAMYMCIFFGNGHPLSFADGIRRRTAALFLKIEAEPFFFRICLAQCVLHTAGATAVTVRNLSGDFSGWVGDVSMGSFQ